MNEAIEHRPNPPVWLPLPDEALVRPGDHYGPEIYDAVTELLRHQVDIPVNLARRWPTLDAKVGPTKWLPNLMRQFPETDDSDSKIAAATTPDDIVSVLEERGIVRAARRIVALSELHETDPDEPEVDLESLKRLAAAMVENPAWGEPRLTLNDEGYVHAEWSTRENGRIAMTFLPSDLVDFAAISAPVTSGAEILRIGGRHIGVEAINAVRWFAARIALR